MATERAGLSMAAGTVVARATGYVRSILLVAALGSGLHADIFAIANTIPNMLVVLLGAGIFNAVLVPQIVRADRRGDGAEYANQVITLFGAVLALATIVLTFAAPWIVGLVLSPGLRGAGLAGQHQAAVAFAYCCLPQAFFYGIFALLGQLLNARGVFGPMMWAPVLNNVVAVAVLALYLATYGPVSAACGGYGSGQVALLGLGTTAGVVVQCVALVPYLRRAGIRYRLTVRVLSPGIRNTLRLGAWTLAVVVVNQVAYGVVVRLASAGSVAGGCGSGTSAAGTGYTVYSSAYLLIMAPHAIVTVSVMTANLPGLAGLASSGDLAGLGRRVSGALRTVMALLVPGVALLELVAPSVANLVWAYGAGAGSSGRFVPTLMWFGVALLFFTAHYVALRGLYALGANRAVFAIQSVIAVVDVALALVLVRLTDAAATAPALAAAYAVAYAVGSVLSWGWLRRRVGGVEIRRTAAGAAKLGGAVAFASAAAVLGTWTVTGHPQVDPGSKTAALVTCCATVVVFLAVVGPVAWAVVRAAGSPEPGSRPRPRRPGRPWSRPSPRR